MKDEKRILWCGVWMLGRGEVNGPECFRLSSLLALISSRRLTLHADSLDPANTVQLHSLVAEFGDMVKDSFPKVEVVRGTSFRYQPITQGFTSFEGRLDVLNL